MYKTSILLTHIIIFIHTVLYYFEILFHINYLENLPCFLQVDLILYSFILAIRNFNQLTKFKVTFEI